MTDIGRIVVTIAGSVALLAAGVFSNSDIELALIGSSSGKLAWGPALFRILLAVHGALLIIAGMRKTVARQPMSRAATHPAAWIALTGLSLLAFGLRLWGLDSSLWLDEVLTMVDYARAPLGTIVSSFPNQNQHMLFSVLAHFSVQVFGEHAWAIRIPSVLFAIASLWALFLFGKRVVSVREALVACALMAVSYHHLWFSQNARGYMGLLFFALLASWLWLESLSNDTWPLWIGYAAVCALGAWTHMTMVFVVTAHVVTYLLFLFRGSSLESSVRWRPFAAWILFGTFTLQLHALALPEFFRTALHEASAQSEWTSTGWVLTEIIRSLRVGFVSIAVLIGGGALAIAGWTGILRRDARAALIMVLPGLLGGITMMALSHNLWPRFFFFTMGFALLIFIRGAVSLSSHILPARLAQPVTAIAALMMIGLSAATLPRCYALPKQDFTGARDFVESSRQPGETVAVVGLASHVYGRYYAPHWQVVSSAEQLQALLQKPGQISLVYTLPIELAAFHPELWQLVKQNFEERKVFPGTLGGGEVYVCLNKRNVEFAPAAMNDGGSEKVRSE